MEDVMRRREAIAEVLSTEISYRQRLTVLHEVFYQRCTSNGLLTRDERDEIFLNVEELLLRSGLLIADLQDKNGAGSGEHLCAVFLRHSKHLENCFERYCVQHSEAGSLLSHLCTENSKFITFLSKSSQNPKCDNLDLSSFLLEPVQRLARYPLLLRQILHYTEKLHKEHDNLLEAVTASEQLVHRVNEAVRLYQSNVRLTKLQEHIVISMIKDDVDFCLVGKTRRNVQRQLLLEMQVHKGKPKKKATFLLLVLTDMIVLLEETHHPHPTGADRDAKFYNFCGQPLGIESVNVCIIEEPIVNGFSAMMRQSGKFYWFEISFGTAKLVLSVDSETDRSRILNSIRSGAKAASAVVEKFQPILTLNCMGTLFIDLHGATKLPDPGKDSLCFGFELNDQRLQCRACSKINSAFVMPMLSFDDRLRITLSRQHPYKPNHTLAATDLSLDFLEYYGEKGTQGYHVSIGPECVILVDFQFRPV